MKPLLLKVSEHSASSFDIRYEKVSHFDNPWHYHPEFELTLITKSTGVRFIGDSIEPFEEGDLVLMGSNLPHYWRNSDSYYESHSSLKAEAIIMRFRLDLWGGQLLRVPEMEAIQNLLKLAEFGIHFPVNTALEIVPILNRTLKSTGTERLICWLQIFEILAKRADFRQLSQKSFGGLNPREDSSRIDKVLAYIQVHLTERINLGDVAAIANMNKTAFCRYFKQQTNKTFIDVLNEIRIQSACRLLIDSTKDISQIAYESGFQDVSYFNQVFKTKKRVSPSEFRSLKTGLGINSPSWYISHISTVSHFTREFNGSPVDGFR
jgi:AraC-like DNA-binding protein